MDEYYNADKAPAGQLMKSTVGYGGLRTPPVRTVIENQIKEFEELISVRKALLQQLDENPGTEKVLDALRKIGI